jgi:archaeosortase A (PGF-CTERM-specific)
MIDAVVGALAALGVVSTPLGWLTIGLFLAGAAIERYDRDYARPVVVLGWLLFGVFWLSMIHHFAVESRSVIEGAGSLLAVPLSVSVALLLARGRDSLFVLSRAVALMGLVYVPVATVPWLRQPLTEAVTDQTAWVMGLLGFDPAVVDGLTVVGPDGTEYAITGKQHPYESTFVFDATGVPWIEQSVVTYTIVTACTGIGSMAIFVGLVLAVRAPARRKLRAFAVSVPVIYVLNIVRNVFIGVTFGNQMTHVFPDVVMGLFALEEPWMVSYIVSDRIVAQGLSVVALVAVTWLVVRELPEVVTVVEDVLYLLTRREYDLRAAMDLPPLAEEPDRSSGSAYRG